MVVGMEIGFDDWKKLELKVGKIVEVQRIPKTEKLYKLQVDIGVAQIQVVASLVPYYTEEELKDRAGEKSEGMLLCAD